MVILRLLAFAGLLTLAASDTFDDAIEDFLEGNNVRGAAVAFYDKKTMSEPIYRGYGKTKASKSSPMVNPRTTFLMASVSKVLMGVAVSILIDQDVISLDADICDVVPDSWPRRACRNPRYPDVKVTWRMLVTHRSSLRENIPRAKDRSGKRISPAYGPTGGYLKKAPAAGGQCPLKGVVGFYHDFFTNQQPLLSNVAKGVRIKGGKKLNWFKLGQSTGGVWMDYKPGSRWSFSNVAFGYLVALIELATGQDFNEWCQENIFDKMKLTHTAWHVENLPTGTRQALPVRWVKQEFLDIGDYCSIDYGSSGLRTTARDMSRLGDAILGYGRGTIYPESGLSQLNYGCFEERLFCRSGIGWFYLANYMKEETTTPKWLKKNFMGYSWDDGIFHDGFEAGVQTLLLVLPFPKLYVIVATNTDGNGSQVAKKLAATVISAPRPDM